MAGRELIPLLLGTFLLPHLPEPPLYTPSPQILPLLLPLLHVPSHPFGTPPPRYDHLDMLLPEELRRNGLFWTEVVEAGRQAAPPSPPPLTELFPDMRIAVFRISLTGSE